jgi:hypothetical protein
MMKPEGCRDTRSLQGSHSISTGSTPTTTKIKRNLQVPVKPLNLPHDRLPLLQSGRQILTQNDAPFIADPMSTSTNLTNPDTNLPRPSARPAPPLNNDEDQDMWDLVDELQVQVKPNEGAKPPIGPPAPVDDDDWDSMYA